MKLFNLSLSLSLSTDLNTGKFSYETLQYKEKITQKYWNTTPKTCRDLGRQMDRRAWRYNEPQPYDRVMLRQPVLSQADNQGCRSGQEFM